MNVNNDDLSLLNEGFASGAIPSESHEYLLKGVWVPQKVFLAWLEEQEKPPFSVVRRSLQSLPEIVEKYPDMFDLKYGTKFYRNVNDPPRKHPQAYLYRAIIAKQTGSPPESSTSSESSTKSEDHTPKSPDNG